MSGLTFKTFCRILRTRGPRCPSSSSPICSASRDCQIGLTLKHILNLLVKQTFDLDQKVSGLMISYLY